MLDAALKRRSSTAEGRSSTTEETLFDKMAVVVTFD
jgi:hypothetical protein